MDSIELQYGHSVINSQGLLFTILQKSVRFEKMKKLVVYEDRTYIGNYQIVDYSKFDLGNLTNMLSLLIFGKKLDEGLIDLKSFKIKGSTSNSTKMIFACLSPIGFDSKYEIPDLGQSKETLYTQKDIVEFMIKDRPALQELITRFDLTTIKGQ